MRLTEEQMHEFYIANDMPETRYCSWCMEEVPVIITEIDSEEGGTDIIIDCELCKNRIVE